VASPDLRVTGCPCLFTTLDQPSTATGGDPSDSDETYLLRSGQHFAEVK